MKTFGFVLLVALAIILAWRFDLLLELERVLDWIQGLGATPRGSYP